MGYHLHDLGPAGTFETQVGCINITVWPVEVHLPAPVLGEHTEALPTGLGYSPELIEKFRRDVVL